MHKTNHGKLSDTADAAWTGAVDRETVERGAEAIDFLWWLTRLARSASQSAGDAGSASQDLPRDFGRFRLLQLLGTGAYGAVFRAVDTRLGKQVALKIAWPGVLVDAEMGRRFAEEPRAMAAIRHPGVAEVYEADEVGMASYISMELIEGPTLAQWRMGRPSVAIVDAVRVIRDIAAAVHAAHLAGVVHRDLKPSNVLLRRAEEERSLQPVVTDFGLARRSDGAARSVQTATCAVVGTDFYMPPEQAAGRNDKVGPRSDVFSLGVMLFELACGLTPFAGDTSEEVRQRIRTCDAPMLRKLRPDAPRDLETIVQKCLAKAPGDRYKTAAELAAELDRLLDQRPIHARPPSAWRRARGFVRRHRVVAARNVGALSFGLLATAVIGSWAMLRPMPDEDAHGALRYEYINGIQQAAEALRRGRRPDVTQFLDRARDAAGGAEACGIAWRLVHDRLGKPERTLDAHPSGVCCVRFTADGSRLYSCGKEGRVLCWNTGDWTIAKEIVIGDDEVHFALPSSDGALLAVACEHGRVVIYRTTDWSKVYDEQAFDGRIFTAAWIGGSGRLAVGGEGSRVSVLDVESNATRTTPTLSAASSMTGAAPVVAEEVESISFDPAQSRFFVHALPRLQFTIDAETFEVLESRQHPEFSAGSICWLPRGPGYLAVACSDAVRFWDPRRKQFLGGHVPAIAHVRSLACSGDGAMLVVGYRNGAIETWDVDEVLTGDTAHVRRFLAHDERVLTLDVAADSAWLASGGVDGRLCLWNGAAFNSPFDAPFDGIIKSVRFSPAGESLAIVETDGAGSSRLLMHDVATGKVRWEAPLGTLAREHGWWPMIEVEWPLAFRPHTEEVAVMRTDFVVEIRDASGGEVRTEIAPRGAQPTMWMQYSPDGRYLIQHPYDGGEPQASWWSDRAAGRPAAEDVDPRNGWIRSLRTAFGDVWLDQRPSREILVRQHGSNQVVATLHGPADGLRVATASADGGTLAAGGVDGTIYLWDLAERDDAAKIIGHSASILDLAFSADSRTLLSLCKRGELRLWDTATRAALLTMGDATNRVVSMALDPQGDALVLATERKGEYGLVIHQIGANARGISRRLAPPK